VKDSSALLKHECAYCLGQMLDHSAVPVLVGVLRNLLENPMVRHEAAEALGAIGSADCIPVLEEFLHDSFTEVSETCQIALDRIKWVQNHDQSEDEIVKNSPFSSVTDPAPPENNKVFSIAELKKRLLDTNLSLFKRYRALFALRDIGDEQAVLAMAEGLNDSSALFRHEIAFVMGQLQHPASAQCLVPVLENASENAMVRHEAAEALGSIANDQTLPLLNKYLHDNERAVKESCVIALDIHDYFTTDQFQYADGLSKVVDGEVEIQKEKATMHSLKLAQ